MNSSRRRFLQAAVPLIAFCQMSPQTAARQPQIPFRPRPEGWQADWYSLNWEAEKQEKQIPTDTLVIHHTASAPGISWQQLSQEQYHRLYGGPEDKDRKNPSPRFWVTDPDPYVYGLPARSGHYRLNTDGVLVEVFYAYHWLIRADGTTERLLSDTEVGWHAGSWAWNMRSIGICFDGDFSTAAPPEAALRSCAKLIAEYAKIFPLKNLKGHNDLRPEPTTCPGAWFYNKPKGGGKTGRDSLLQMSGIVLAA